ncbi:hypothetical protein EDD16DRAFT_23482 [Pisolithus croceorrhizus]|nr:hypothetical protein EDD16DRAFT_23482 [Pisolithus croceorrhizus]
MVILRTRTNWTGDKLQAYCHHFGSISDYIVCSCIILFLRRVHAVYFGSKDVQYTFSFLWIVGICASGLLLYDAIHGYHEIANTKHCIRQQYWAALPVAFGIPVSFDCLVYCAIMHKILSTHRTGQKKGWRYYLCPSKGLPHFSRAVFEGGQQYYLITNGINWTRLSFSTNSTITPSYQVVLSQPL